MRVATWSRNAVAAVLLVVAGMLVHDLAWAPAAPYKLKLPGVISYELNLPSLVAHANKLVKRAITFEEFTDPAFAGACP